jgi:hypothetical protein
MFNSFELMALAQRGSVNDPIDLASAHGFPLTANTTTSMGGKVGGNLGEGLSWA